LGHKSANSSLVKFTYLARTIELKTAIVEKTIELRKRYKIKLPDAIKASTPLVENLILLSRNEKDFTGIPELKFKNPYKIILDYASLLPLIIFSCNPMDSR